MPQRETSFGKIVQIPTEKRGEKKGLQEVSDQKREKDEQTIELNWKSYLSNIMFCVEQNVVVKQVKRNGSVIYINTLSSLDINLPKEIPYTQPVLCASGYVIRTITTRYL